MLFNSLVLAEDRRLIDIVIITIAGNGTGAGKSTCATILINELSKHANTERYSFAAPLKQFLIQNGIITEQQAYDPAYKETATDFTFNTFIAASALTNSLKDPKTAVKTLLQYVYIPKGIRVNIDALIIDIEEGTRPRGSETTPEELLPSLRNAPLTARAMMQLFGTEVMRKNFCYDIWLKLATNRLFIDAQIENKKESSIKVAIFDDARFKNETNIIEYLTRKINKYRGEGGDYLLWEKKIYINRPNRKTTSHASEGQIMPDNSWNIVYNNGTLFDFQQTCKDLCPKIMDLSTDRYYLPEHGIGRPS